MSAQPHEPAPADPRRPEPTIRSVRAALPPDIRAVFQAAIEQAALHEIPRALAAWDLRARALADPRITAAARRIEDERAGRTARPRTLTDGEIRAVWPALRP
ncbi:hypothetical protein ACIQGZ_17295 [Streptomyces sp. NPDC092296]|uniref:hypothetical protein n=1 Tax=Streptomyces sp. NPDC092296 TaxID=3366012 RepID=UPI0037F757AF